MNKSIHVVAIGEILWDMLPEEKRLGGAPANFIFYCNELGLNAHLISAVGNDELGKELLSEIPFNKDFISVNSKPTSKVEVKLESGIPSYNIIEEVAWDFLELDESVKDTLQHCQAICFGTLAQRSIQSKEIIQEVLKIVPDHCMKIFDVNLRQNYYSLECLIESFQKANFLKINEEELEIICNLFNISGSDEKRIKTLMDKYSFTWLALTKGVSGSYVFHEKEVDYQPINKVEVQDTVGAGDAFLAGLVSGILKGQPLSQAHKQACQISSYVCGQKGAMNQLKIKNNEII